MTLPKRPSHAERRLARLERGVAAYVHDGPAVAELGAGPTFVLVHGLPGSSRDFRWLAPVLASHGAQVLRVEMPGFGETPLATEPDPSVEARGRFVVALTHAISANTPVVHEVDRRPWLVGHSMGGVVGAMAATLSPASFRGLALVSSPGLRVHQGLRRARPKLLGALIARPLVARALSRPVRALFERSGFRHATDAELLHTIRCIAVTEIAPHAARLRTLPVPVMHAYCDADPFIERAILDETAHELGGPVVRFAEGGHNPQKYQAVELGQALMDWAAGRLGG